MSKPHDHRESRTADVISPIAAVSDAVREHLPQAGTQPIEVTDRDRRNLAEALAVVPDPRRRRGVRHRLTPLPAATVRTVGWAGSFAAIVQVDR